MRTAVIGGGVNRTVDRGSGKARRKLRNEEFDDLCVEKDDEFMEGEIDGSVTYRAVYRK